MERPTWKSPAKFAGDNECVVTFKTTTVDGYEPKVEIVINRLQAE